MVVPIADNLTTQTTVATIPASSVIATDQLTINSTAAHVQRLKVVAGKDGTYTGDVAGRNVDGDSNASALYVDNRFNVAHQKQNSSGLTTASTNYSSGDTLGSGWTFTSMARVSGGTGLITGVTLIDKADVMAVCDLYVFDASVTFGTDNAGPGLSDSDAEHFIARLSMTFDDVGGVRVASLDSLSLSYECSGGTSLYVYAVTRSANVFFVAATDLRLRLSYQQD